MKRSILLLFILIVLQAFLAGEAFAVTTLSNGSLVLQNDADVNTYTNFGDTIRVQAVATYTLGSVWIDAPSVNCTSVGRGIIAMNLIDAATGLYRVDIQLNAWHTANYTPLAFTISAMSSGETTPVTISTAQSLNIDVAKVNGVSANATPLLSGQGDQITISIVDNSYQSAPDGGTIAMVDLTPFGGNANTPMTGLGAATAPRTFSTTYIIPAGINRSSPLTIRLSDPMISHPTVSYVTNSITVDTGVPNVTEASVTILSGNTIARPDDRLQLKIRVSTFDNESVTASCSALTNVEASPAINGGHTMPLTASSGLGQPAEWTLNIDLKESTLTDNALPITFRVTDPAGNYVIQTVNVKVDLLKPSFMTANAIVLLDNKVVSSLNNIATTSCYIRFAAELQLPYDGNVVVFTDLTSISGSAEYILNRPVSGIASYVIDFPIAQGILEDGQQHTFSIFARDTAGNIIARATTPPIGIDNNPPTLASLQLTSSNTNNSNIIRVGDNFTVQCTITGIENGSATVNLSAIGASPAQLTYAGSNIYRGTWVLPTASESTAIPAKIDGYTSFKISVNDTVLLNTTGHLITGDTNQLMIDNEPPFIATSAYTCTHNLYPTYNNGSVRVGDTVKFYAKVASEPISVKINMVSLGKSNSETMSQSTNPLFPSTDGWYEYQLSGGVPEGVINSQNTVFRVTATDDAGNADYEDLVISIDNNPVKVGSFDLDVTYINSPADDTNQSIINLNKKLNLTLILSENFSDLGTASINLSNFGLGSNATMTYNIATNAYSLGFSNNIPLNYDSSNHIFVVTLTDQSGNHTIVQSAIRRVDNWRPELISATASLPLGGAKAKIGDTILFEVEVKDNENIAPVINLANLGLSSAQAMNLDSTTAGVNLYKYSAVVANGTMNGANTLWEVTARDNDLNYVTMLTNPLNVDSKPPQIFTGLIVTSNNDPDYIKLGDTLTFSIELASDTTVGTVTVDMRSIISSAGAASVTLDSYHFATGTLAVKTVSSMLSNTEYPNYRFTATVSDTAANKITSQSQVFAEVDCRPTILSSHGIVLWQDNGLINPEFAGPGDVLMVWASATNHLDAVLTANLASGSPMVDFATATMIFNATRNRHEATFTVATSTPAGTWNPIIEAPQYRITAVDNVGNLASTTGLADFTVRNISPAIDTSATQISLSPNGYWASTTSDILVYNLASDTAGDCLVASITFNAGLPMHRAWLDFRDFGTGTVELLTSGSMGQTPSSGIAVAKLPRQENISGRVYVYGMDKAGNISYASRSFIIDNIAPKLSSAEFDGRTLQVGLSEDYFDFNVKNWQIVGSSTIGSEKTLNFYNAPFPAIVNGWSSFELKFDDVHLREMAQWASTPIYLKVTSEYASGSETIATSAITDKSGNQLRPVNYFPITITDSTWREPAKITQFTVSHNWLATTTITLDLFFNKDIDPGTLCASSGVLLVEPISSDFTNIDYTTGYVFQASTTASALDTYNWPDKKHLQIILCSSGSDWVARKLGNGTKKLRFAIRSAWHTLVLDTLGKPSSHIPTSAPIIATDNRPTPGFGFNGPPDDLVLDIGNKTLTLKANDRLLLFTSDFVTSNSLLPAMSLPTPTTNTRVTGFHNKVTLHDTDSGNSAILQLEALDKNLNNEYASNSVTLTLTDDDLTKVLNLYQANANPIWGISISAGAFTNLWGTQSNAYLPSGNPGPIDLKEGTPTEPAAIAAISISDKSPVSKKLAGELFYEVEVFPPRIGGVTVPIQWQNTPITEIRQQGVEWLASGTFISYSERTVDGKLRSVFRYSNNVALPDNKQGVPAQIDIYGVKDIFGNQKNFTASYAYDLNTKSNVVQGFTDTASLPIVIDTRLPVVSLIIPNDYIGKIPANSIFRVNFDEIMDAATIPTLTINTTPAQSMGFTFSSWTATATAEFTNNSPFTSSLPNGTWFYQVSGGRDAAGNTMLTTGANSFPVEVRTYAPEVVPGKITLRTVQSIISATKLINKPWSQYAGEAEFSIEYTTPPSLNLPHYLQIFDSVSNAELGIVDIQTDGSIMATATFYALSPGVSGPTSYAVRIIDSLNNRTEILHTVVYDGLAPAMTSFNLTGSGIGSTTSEFTYFRPQLGNLSLSFSATTTDTLQLAVYPEGGATVTQLLNAGGLPGTYNIATGSSFANGTYTLSIIDLAGNLGTGSSTRKIIADRAAPTMVSIVPEYSLGKAAPYYIGKCNAGETRVYVTFSEPMDADLAQVSTLSFASGASIIHMEFVNWVNPLIASTAIYRNIEPVTAIMPSGTYKYTLGGGRDLAFNARTPASDQTKTVEVYTAGPFATITSRTDQSHIYGSASGIQTNAAFNPAFGNGSAAIRIDFTGGMLDSYNLAVFDGVTQIGTYTGLPNTNPVNINLENNPPNASWTWTALHPTDRTYNLRVSDSSNSLSPSYSFRYDTTAPTIDTPMTITGFGIATSTQYGFDALYHSPDAGAATFTITTTNSDIVKFLVFNTISTHTANMLPGPSNHQALWSSLNNAMDLIDGPYMGTAVDMAGNLAIGAASTSLIIIDRTRPELVDASAIIAGFPSYSTGVIATNSGIFELTFNEGMNTAVAPVLTLSYDSTNIAMSFTSWISSTTCRFTNAVAINKNYTPGIYSFIASNSRDYAGNKNIIPDAGSFTIELFTEEPDLTSTQLVSQQTALYDALDLINRPLSFESYAAGPDIATLTINYNTAGNHPFQTPHLIRIYDSFNTMVSESLVAQVPTAETNEITIDSAMLGNPGAATESYSFRLVDSIGNISATFTIPIRYDGVQPFISAATFSSVSNAAAAPLYYNEQLYAGLKVRFSTNASDPLVLVFSGISLPATATFEMSSNTSTGVSTFTLPVVSATLLAEGQYWITAADMAGNIADGAASTTLLIVDRTLPTVLLATTSTGLPATTTTARGATFTVQFDEDMNDLASATPALIIATSSAQIACTFVSWIASDTAQFVNTAAISNSIPQGDYNCNIIAWDITGNKLNTSNGGVIAVRSRGPVVSSIVTRSYQSTTASSTLVSGDEILLNQPFSLNVAPGASIMSIQLAQAPDGIPTLTYLHFTDLPTGNTTIASYPLTLTGNAATFTWSIASGPQPTTPTTYLMRLADSNGDFSLESHEWRIDNASPTVNSLTFTGGENNIASNTIYFNPFKHPYIAPKFGAVENEAPRMRVKNGNSTDTYQLSGAGTNLWSTNFTGVYSRNPAAGSAIRLPDGKYDIGLVDRAGNVAASGSENLYSMVIDTQSPLVATYTMYVASQPVSTYFSPSAGNLDIFVFSATEPLTATGVYYLEILNLVGTRINRLPLVASASGYLASWNGKNDQGNLVSDSEYTFRASDYVGNIATATAKIFVMTSEFKVTGVTQIASTSAQIWLNHDIQNSSLTATSVTASPAMIISNIRLSGTKTISFDTATAFAHATSYTFTVANGPGGVKNIYGSALTATGSQIIMVADGQGPVIAGHSFTGLSSQNEFKIIFDEAFDITTAANKASYTLKNASSTVINISQAVPQSDQKTVVLTAEQLLVENKDYSIAAAGVTDTFGNAATTTAYVFQGRDLTPPKLVVSAFSNPANEKDIIVLATSDEPLKAPPTLYVKHGSAAAVSVTMQAGVNPKAFMAGVSLNAANGNTGTLLVQGEDISDNQGSGEGSFTIAYVSANMLAQVLSKDNQLLLNFSVDSLKTDATVKILQHQLVKETADAGLIKTSLQNEFRAARGLRSSQINVESQQNNVELVPVTDSYEVSIATEKVNKGFTISLTAPEATSTIGLGLFNQSGDTWKFVTADLSTAKAFTAKAVSSQIFAIMQDVVAPRINLDAGLDLSEPFRTSRPEFIGQILESGAGLDNAALTAHIDGGPAQSFQVDSDGQFIFKPLVELTGGNHDLVIRAADRTGNQSQTSALRFVVNVPLNIGQIMQYPNPASRRGYIRISANRDDLNDDLVKISIYDVAGHKVTTLNNVRSVKETWNGVNSRFLYDIAWDLRNEDGKQVANGVYFARIEVRDPENPSTKIKKNFKLAVLR